jgi:hypothetical protein
MAENKEIVVKLTLDTKGAEQATKGVEQNLKDIEDSLKDIGSSGATDGLTQQMQKLNSVVENQNLTWGEAGKAIEQYQNIALAAGATSPVGQEAIKRAGQLKQEVDTLTRSIDNAAQKGKAMQGALAIGSTVTAGYGAMQGVMALAGQESEVLMNSLVKMQAAQSVLAGIEQLRLAVEKEGILMMTLKNAQTKIATVLTGAYAAVVGTTTGGLKLLRLALISTGIGAIVVALGLLIANFDVVVSFVKKAYKSFTDLGMGVKIVLSILFPFVGLIWGVVEALTAMGVIDDEVTSQAKKNAAAKIKAVNDESKAQRAKADAIMKAAADEIAAIDSTVKQLDFELAVRQAGGEDIKDLERQRIDLILERVRVEKEALDASIEIYDQNIKNLKAANSEFNQLFNAELMQNKILLKAKQEALVENTKMGEKAVLDDAVFKAKEVKAEKDAIAAKSKARKEANDKRIEEEKRFAEKQRIAEADAQAKFLQDLAALEDEYLTSKLSQEQQEINAVYDKYFAILEAAKKNGEDITLLEEAQAKAVQGITDKYAKEKKDKQLLAQNELEAQLFSLREESLQKTLEGFDIEEANEVAKLKEKLDSKLITEEQFEQAKLALAKYYDEQGKVAISEADQKELDQKIAMINQVGEYASQGFEILSNLSSAFSKDSEKDARRQFNINKAAGIAQATTSTASAIMAQLAVPQDALTGANFVKAGIAGAIGFSQIAKIAATKFQPSGGGGGGGDKISIPSVASGGANGGSNGQAQQNDNLTNIAQLLNQQGGPVLVVDSFNKVDRASEKIKTVASI